jgi:hypothetical protein
LTRLGYTSGLSSQLARAGEWFLCSGIQEPNGGVARYHRTDTGRNLPVSTEITGYALSAFLYLDRHSTGGPYLDAAHKAARFLMRQAWDRDARVMPFEIGPAEYAYFFDCGIVVRGLLAYWHAARDQEALDTALAIGKSMLVDFAGPEGEFHPILSLPSRAPLEYEPARWSRAPGCYQLKSAMAWWDLFEVTGEERFRAAYEQVLEYSLATWRSFLPGPVERQKVMDRLHAFSYFLEGLLPGVEQDSRCAAALAEGIDATAHYLRDLAPEFARSDVFAQLLRARLYADHAGVAPLNRACADWEATQLAAFQRADGGYWFGRRDGEWLPFSNPVSTAFAAQALDSLCNGLAPRQLLI